VGAFSADAPASQLPHGPGRHVPSLLLRGKILLQVLARCCTSTISHLANHPQLLQRYDVCMYPPHMTCIHLANHPQLLLLLLPPPPLRTRGRSGLEGVVGHRQRGFEDGVDEDERCKQEGRMEEQVHGEAEKTHSPSTTYACILLLI
jgi:hypothetical protein